MSIPRTRNVTELAVGVPLTLALATGVVQLLPPPAAARPPATRPQSIPMPAVRPGVGPRYVLAAAAAGTVAS